MQGRSQRWLFAEAHNKSVVIISLFTLQKKNDCGTKLSEGMKSYREKKKLK